ncbi:hypothetical protein J3Q64DRAFT_1811683 [Phycomyces blakesleeanus]|uniref:RING-type E3 ubiquitin transferase n=1 Tax=Phycomyces blakesleeanus TaxID=4837 RepID=A0ABR3ALS8_PHYBL
MLPNNESMITTKKSLAQRIDEQIEKLEKMAEWNGQQLMDSEERSQTVPFECQFQLFGQLHPVPENIKRSHLIEYEKELEDPQGIRTIRPPPLELSSIMYAPNCGLSLATNGTGMKIETYYSKAVSYAGMASFLAILQIFSLIHQMEFTPTPSSVTNVSYWTIVMQAIMDGYLCLLHLTAGIVVDAVFIPFAATAFFNFVLVSVFGMRYLLVIWRIQRPEVVRTTRPRPQPAPRVEEEIEGETPPAVPANATPVREERSSPTYDVGTLYCKLYISLLVGLFLFYHTATSSAFVQNIVIAIVGLAFYSFWIPQSIRSISRGCRRPLSPKYVVGMSISRLAIPLYFYGCPENVLAHKTTPWIWALVVYMAFQVLILFLQDLLGPRFFVPERFLPQTYNYHPILATEDEETLQGEEEAGGSSGTHSRDCAILDENQA